MVPPLATHMLPTMSTWSLPIGGGAPHPEIAPHLARGVEQIKNSPDNTGSALLEPTGPLVGQNPGGSSLVRGDNKCMVGVNQLSKNIN